MNARSFIRLAPITSGLIQRNPRILLGGDHPPTLLKYLDGWPKRWGTPRTFLIQFVREGQSLSRFADNSFDFAVMPSPSAEALAETVGELVRVARQGLITRR